MDVGKEIAVTLETVGGYKGMSEAAVKTSY